MVSRSRVGRYDSEARDADLEAPSPWSEDQATTCYVPEQLYALPGVASGVPPLPERFAPAQQQAAHAPLREGTGGFEDEATQWLEPSASWDASPPRRSAR